MMLSPSARAVPAATEAAHRSIDVAGRRVGVLTIGQSPRPDGLAEDIVAALAPGMAVVERGALDDLADDEIRDLAPRSADDYRLVTLLRDGRSVEVRKQAILPLLQRQIDDLERRERVDATLLMCTGAFPTFRHARPLLLPQAALYGAVVGIAGTGRIGALIPLATQRDQARAKWAQMGVVDVEIIAASPYGEDPLAAAAAAGESARKAGVDVLFMDCFGYDRAMKAAARRRFGGPVVLARTLAARLIAELSE